LPREKGASSGLKKKGHPILKKEKTATLRAPRGKTARGHPFEKDK